ncbi:TPA: restriction endonuclease subunit S [Klebsiella oxytoca]|nr:restriction endonuclease subunit S [Klebsiella oxytoca]
MSEWRKLPLKEITVKIGSGSTPTGGSGAYKETGISLIRSQNVLDFSFTNNGLAFIDEEQAQALRNVIVEPQDVLLNITGDSVARCCSAPKEWLPARVNQHVAIIRANQKHLDSLFLKYSLISIKDELLSLSEIGGTRNALTKGMLENLKLFLPSVVEQKAIASVLSSLDDKIDLLYRQNKTLESMAEALFRQWFIEETQDEWRLSSFDIWINDTKGGDWGKEFPIDDFIYPVQCVRGTDISDLQNGLPSRTPLRFIKSKKFINISPDNGDIIIEISGGTENQSTGRSYFINEELRDIFKYPIVFSNFCRLLKIKKEEHSYFVHLYLSYLYKSDEMFAFENGSSGIKNLDYKTMLFKEKYKMPPSELVEAFHEKVKSYFSKIISNKKQMIKLQILRDTLLPKLMSGEVRVEYAEEKIESVA